MIPINDLGATKEGFRKYKFYFKIYCNILSLLLTILFYPIIFIASESIILTWILSSVLLSLFILLRNKIISDSDIFSHYEWKIMDNIWNRSLEKKFREKLKKLK